MTNAPLSSSMVILDRTHESESKSILYAFALEELLCRSIGKTAPPVLHIWRHPRAFVMGLRDSRLPEAALANKWLLEQGYDTAVRNSGGAAVPLDLGVVNVSLLLPKEAGDMEHRKDFELMVALIRELMSKLTDRIDQGEIMGSFCPGEFDLSVGGRKFCGIAQRRQQRALSVQAFIIVEGEGEAKASLARGFYERAAGSADPNDYPAVAPGSMASLAECLNIPLTAEQFTENLIEMLSTRGMQVKGSDAIPGYPDEGQIADMVELMRERYAIKQ
ncbi:lipoate--protein ligase family protein [Paenibacillus aceris]|uniref:Octanoyl-[GcvH]:protein N-octanoyltransferase n=1 Tax=Paenibacillus aceris TaxID=869555 RepID=A0ABS4IBB8_9BACL|nr:lipoate--protein ligase family protein [Paenibacillus aceris]MBP1967374.1 octanoyl-[GcvH]:protein N-octanoyltransferase [Paenibacillus aceris]NHW39270.1 lipoate--protein ligase family protein [Paenibacillus aceris]